MARRTSTDMKSGPAAILSPAPGSPPPPWPVWRVPYIDLRREFESLRSPIMKSVESALLRGAFILRDDVRAFEESIASMLGLPPAVGLNSGTDALYFAARLAGLKHGDEVITSPHTFVATVAAIAHTGARPVLVDVKDDFNIDPSAIRAALTRRTRAIIPVHMNGRISDMDDIMEIAASRKLTVIEDAAQALGARWRGRSAGSFGHFGCFSLHPMKILNAAGDAGFITIKDAELLLRARQDRNHGQSDKETILRFGYSSRLDNLQAAILNAKLPRLDWRIARRRALASRYDHALLEIPQLRLPPPPSDGVRFDVFSSYVIRSRRRNALVHHLVNDGIEVMVHWAKPLHRHEGLKLEGRHLRQADRLSREVISLPIFPEMTNDQQSWVIESIKRFHTMNRREANRRDTKTQE